MTPTEDWLVIANPRSRSGRGRLLAAESTKLLRAHGIRHDVVETESPGHVRNVAAAAREDGYARIVAIGGDGAAHHAANGAIAARLPFGLIPAEKREFPGGAPIF